MLTKSQIKALNIIKNNEVEYPKQFAWLYFPSNHPGWARHTKCGPKGTSKGGGLVLWAGGYLGKLAKAGLISPVGFGRKYRLTEKGKRLLDTMPQTD